MQTFILSVLISLFLTSSCKTSKPATADSTPVKAPVTAPPDMKPSADSTCRLIISFISIGEGTDPKAKETLDSSVKNWEERFNTKFQIESIPWGREGEVDFCFNLDAIQESEREIFVDEIKSVFEGNKLVQISENQRSRYKK